MDFKELYYKFLEDNKIPKNSPEAKILLKQLLSDISIPTSITSPKFKNQKQLEKDFGGVLKEIISDIKNYLYSRNDLIELIKESNNKSLSNTKDVPEINIYMYISNLNFETGNTDDSILLAYIDIIKLINIFYYYD